MNRDEAQELYDMIVHWSGYAIDYFQDKWKLKEDIERAKQIVEGCGKVSHIFELDISNKVSFNDFYEGGSWKFRHSVKKKYKKAFQEFHHRVSSDSKYNVDYEFSFKSRPLDSTNTMAMVKMIEDIIFEKDNYKIVRRVSTVSNKGEKDFVKITVWEIT